MDWIRERQIFVMSRNGKTDRWLILRLKQGHQDPTTLSLNNASCHKGFIFKVDVLASTTKDS